MLQQINTKLIALIFLFMSVVLISSCEKDEDSGPTKVELLSFGPTGTNHGDTLKFIGNNLDRVTSIIFTGTNATVEKNAFIQQDSKLILLLVPEGAEKGYVTLKTPEGDIISKTQLNLGVTVVVSSITPEARPGSNITLTGNFLNWVESISFAEDKLVETFVSQSLNELVVTVPDDAQTGPLILKYGGTDSTFMETEDTLKVTLPVGTGFSPNPVMHAADLTITGSNLDLVKEIIFTGAASPVTSFVSQSVNELVVKIPAGTRKGKVTFQALSGVQTISEPELDVILPWSTNLSPIPILPGANLTISGTNLNLVKEILFTGVTTPVTIFESQSSATMVVKVPAGAHNGKLTFITALDEKTLSDTELELVRPAVTTMSPNPVSIGAELTITGTNLNLVSGINLTGVASTVTTFVNQSATQIIVKVPTGTLIGNITLNILNSTVTVNSITPLQIVGSTLAPIVVYDNALSSNWEKWGGWGTSVQDLDNTEHPNSGSKAIKVSYSEAYGGIQLHPKTTFTFPPAGYTKLKISLYGGAGTTATSRVAIYMKDATDPTDAQKKPLTLVPGVYTTYEILLSDFTNNPAKVNEFVIQNYGTANITVYIDDISFQ